MRTAVLALCLVLVACGGGGGGVTPKSPAKVADLEVAGELSPEIIAVGEQTEVIFKITNIGNATAPESVFYVELTDDALNVLDTVIWDLPAIAPGGEVFVQEFVTAGAGDEGKTFHVFGSVNVDGSDFEDSDLDNNITFVTFQVAAAG